LKGVVHKEVEPHECQVPRCRKEATKEVYINKTATVQVILFLCDEHFEMEEKYWTKVRQSREIFDLKPQEDERVKVSFT
jgi:hypothetical protein